jgi:putative heme-binding domain-containing protein
MIATRTFWIAAPVIFCGLSALPLSAAPNPARPRQEFRPEPAIVAKTSPEDVAEGKKLYEANCSGCHGLDGGGGMGPSIQGLPQRVGDDAVAKIVRNGIPGTGMNGYRSINVDDTARLLGYLRTLGRTDTGVTTGDPQKGRVLYDANGCAGCHIISGQGGGVGPELTRVGAMRGPNYLRTTLLAPGTDLPREAGAMERGRFTQFVFVHVVTEDGRSVDGTRVSEDSFKISLKDASGKFHTFRKLEVRSVEKLPGKSIMPSYKASLSSVQVEDLVAYLAGLKGAQ